MKISVIHPSRNRAALAANTIAKWKSQANEAIEYILVIDNNDEQIDKYHEISKLHGIEIIVGQHESAIEAINNGAKSARGDLFVIVSDDFDCFPNWDLYLKSNLNGRKDFIVKTSDGYGTHNWIITLPILDKFYYSRFGYIYHPDYQHLWCDTEMTAVAMMLDKIINLESSNHIFKHHHHTIGGIPKDSISEKNDATWKQGEDVFHRRHQNNFDLKPEEIRGSFDYSKYIHV